MPLQLAVFPLQFPVLAATDMPVYMPPSGLLQFGAFVQLRPLVTTVAPTGPAQETAGAVIAVPSPTNVEGMLAQVSVYVRAMLELLGNELELLLELGATDELLGFELDDNTAAELELGATDELLGFELDDNTAAELELCATDELLCGMLELLGSAFELLELCATDELLCTAFELLDRELELLVFVPELLGATDELELS